MLYTATRSLLDARDCRPTCTYNPA